MVECKASELIYNSILFIKQSAGKEWSIDSGEGLGVEEGERRADYNV